MRALFSVVVYFYTGNLHLYLDIFATTKNFRSYCEECSDVFRSRWISVQKFGWNSPVFGKYRSYWLWPVNDLIGNADYFLAIILSVSNFIQDLVKSQKLRPKTSLLVLPAPPVFFLNQVSGTLHWISSWDTLNRAINIHVPCTLMMPMKVADSYCFSVSYWNALNFP